MWVGDDSHVDFGLKFPGEKESVRQCFVIMQRPVILSPKFATKCSHIFTQSLYDVTVLCGVVCSVRTNSL
jgi:hypothetical protein